MKRILVVEDDKNVRENLIDILSIYGYKALEANNGLQGLDIVRNNEPDLILCDVMMPELSGYEMLEQIKGDAKYKDIPFIFITARSRSEEIRKGLSLGACDYITKPFRINEIIEVIKNHI